MAHHKQPLVFHKYHALGNDFIIIGPGEENAVPDGLRSSLSTHLCRRRFGIGSDGLIVIEPDPPHCGRMHFFNPDGSRAEMCGNGIRCMARFLKSQGVVTGNETTITTDVGPRRISFHGEEVAVNLGTPSFEPEDLPALLPAGLRNGVNLQEHAALPLPLPRATCLSIGNPHCVFIVDDLERFPVQATGPVIEHLPLFPERINVVFCLPVKRNVLACRVWERGAGETQACGTGASAALIAATLQQKVPGKAEVSLPGGTLKVSWHPTEGVTICGEVSHVYSGSATLPSGLRPAAEPRLGEKELTGGRSTPSDV